MLQIDTLINAPTPSNCYILSESSASPCIIVDPGTEDCTQLTAFLKDKKLIPEYVIVTPEHFDHCIGCNKLKEYYSDLKIIASRACSLHMPSTQWNLSEYAEKVQPTIIRQADILIENIDDELYWQNYRLQFFEARGHSEGSVCFSIGNLLFTGDTLIKGYKTVTTLKGGSKQHLLDTFRYLSDNYNAPGIKVYPGHEEPFHFSEIREALEKQTAAIELKLKNTPHKTRS